MPRLPRVSGKDTVRALRRAGFVQFDQTGSHAYLHRFDGFTFGPRVTVPIHGRKTLAPKTLKAILEACGLTVDEFISAI